jgi:hypothetical protein
MSKYFGVGTRNKEKAQQLNCVLGGENSFYFCFCNFISVRFLIF